MRQRVVGAAAAVLATSGLLGLLVGCAGTETTRPPQPTPTPTPTPTTPPRAHPSVDADRLPLGLEVRYVSRDGRFVTVAPEDFAR